VVLGVRLGSQSASFAGFDNLAVMGEPVEERGGHLGVAEGQLAGERKWRSGADLRGPVGLPPGSHRLAQPALDPTPCKGGINRSDRSCLHGLSDVGVTGLRQCQRPPPKSPDCVPRSLTQARAVVSTSEAMIKHLRLEIAKLRREQCGRSPERRARLIDQMELQLEELEAAAIEDELVAEMVARITPVAGVQRRRPARKAFPEPLPRERVAIEAPTTCTRLVAPAAS